MARRPDRPPLLRSALRRMWTFHDLVLEVVVVEVAVLLVVAKCK